MTMPSLARRALGALAALALFSCAPVAPPPAEPAALPGTLSVGVARIDITPAEPIRLMGYGSRREPSVGVEQRLWAKALAFGSDREGPSVLITADLVGVPRELTERLAGRLQTAGVERARLAVAVTHTHTGPALSGVLPNIFGEEIPPAQRAVIDAYTEELARRLEAVALAALADRRPAHVAWDVGRVGFAANRRVLENGRWKAFGVVADGPVDHDLPVLTVRDPEGGLRAVLLSYAAHATTLEGKHNFVHGDWPGTAQQLIEGRHPGAVALVMIGTGADANPNPRGNGLTDVLRHATEVADEVDRLLSSPLRPVRAAPRGRFRYLDLALARVPTRSELEEQARGQDAAGFSARAALRELDRGQALPATVPYPVQAWTFGDDLAMVFLGGEVVVDYGLRLKRELDGRRLWVNAYANDVAFYVASRRMIPEGGYEVDRSMLYYGLPSRLADSTEETIVAAVRSLLPERFSAPGR